MSKPDETGGPSCTPAVAEKSISELLLWSKSSALLQSTPKASSPYIKSSSTRLKASAQRSVTCSPHFVQHQQQPNFRIPPLLSSKNPAAISVFQNPSSHQQQGTNEPKKPVKATSSHTSKQRRKDNPPRPVSNTSLQQNRTRLSNQLTLETELEVKEEDNWRVNDQTYDKCIQSIIQFNAKSNDASGKSKNQTDLLTPRNIIVIDQLAEQMCPNSSSGDNTGDEIPSRKVALLDKRTICDYLVKAEEVGNGRSAERIQSPHLAESQSSPSWKPKIRISTNIFETQSQTSSCNEELDDFDIQMDREIVESNASDNDEDNLEYSLSLQKYLQSTDSTILKNIGSRKQTSSRDNARKHPIDFSSESNDSTTSEDSDDDSSLYSRNEAPAGSTDLHSADVKVTNQVSESCDLNVEGTDKNSAAVERPLLKAETSSENGSHSFPTRRSTRLSEQSKSGNGNKSELDPYQNEDSCELISLCDSEEDVKTSLPDCIPRYRICPNKPALHADDGMKNKRTGAKKIRFFPARPRNYAYRRRDWRCTLCHTTMKYGSRFLHLQLKHDRPYICTHCPFESKKRWRLRKHILLKHRGNGRPSTKFQCDSCHRNFCFQETLDRHKKVHSNGIFSVKCITCGKEFRSTRELGRHLKTDHPGDKPFQCQKCEKAYKTSSALKIHILGKHENMKPYICDKCGLGFTRRDKMEHHKNRHFQKENNLKQNAMNCKLKCPHIKPTLMGTTELYICKLCGHVCEFCSYIFQSNRLFNAHTHHNFCALCVIKFPTAVSYKLHVAYHEPEDVTVYRCELCKFGFTSIRFLNIHAMKMHRMKLLAYSCPICTKTFNKPHLLKAHTRRVHESKRAHKCPWCKDSFITVTLLNFHLHLKHTQERHYQCETCKKEFVQRTDLNRHVKTHTEERLFECSICDLKLKSNRNLQLHLQIHELRKSYLCDICGVKVKQQCYLKLHKKLHEEEGKPYPCLYCDKSYLKPEALKDHVVSVHGFKDPYSCDKCHKPFSTKQGLTNHHRNASCGKRMGPKKRRKSKSTPSVSSSSDEEWDSKSMSGGSRSLEGESSSISCQRKEGNEI